MRINYSWDERKWIPLSISQKSLETEINKFQRKKQIAEEKIVSLQEEVKFCNGKIAKLTDINQKLIKLENEFSSTNAERKEW